jgi:hypothetical protein
VNTLWTAAVKLSPLPFFYKINNRVVGMKLSRVKWIAVIVSNDGVLPLSWV